MTLAQHEALTHIMRVLSSTYLVWSKGSLLETLSTSRCFLASASEPFFWHPALPLLRSEVARGTSACCTRSSLRADRGGDALCDGVEKLFSSASHAGRCNRFGSSSLFGLIKMAELHGVGRQKGTGQ